MGKPEKMGMTASASTKHIGGSEVSLQFLALNSAFPSPQAAKQSPINPSIIQQYPRTRQNKGGGVKYLVYSLDMREKQCNLKEGTEGMRMWYDHCQPQNLRRSLHHSWYLPSSLVRSCGLGAQTATFWSQKPPPSFPRAVSTPFATPQHVSRSRTTNVLPNRSACDCINAALTVMPPSANMRSTKAKLSSLKLSFTRKRMDSRIAASIFWREVARLRPTSPPCTPVFQKGEQMSPKEGKKQSPSPLTSSQLFSSPQSEKNPARLAQFSVPPPHSTEHSQAQRSYPAWRCRTVVTKEGWMRGVGPILASRKHPVPQVILASFSCNSCAQADDCWSPRMQHTCRPASGPQEMVATGAKESTIRGSMARVIPATCNSSSSQSPVLRSHRYVLEALEASVMYSPVRLKITQVSIVPKRTCPASTPSRIPDTCSIIHRILKSVKQVETGSPVLARNFSPCLAVNSSHTALQRVSHQTMALWSGFPCVSQHTTVYRWLVIPTPSTYASWKSALACRASSTAPAMHFLTLAMISRGSCSSHPSLGVICLCQRRCLARRCPRGEQMQHLVEVVDWSTLATKLIVYLIVMPSHQCYHTPLPHRPMPSHPHTHLTCDHSSAANLAQTCFLASPCLIPKTEQSRLHFSLGPICTQCFSRLDRNFFMEISAVDKLPTSRPPFSLPSSSTGGDCAGVSGQTRQETSPTGSKSDSLLSFSMSPEMVPLYLRSYFLVSSFARRMRCCPEKACSSCIRRFLSLLALMKWMENSSVFI